MEQQVGAWSEMPLWLPEEAAPHLKGFMCIDPHKAVEEGLTFRLLSATINDTLSWFRAKQANEPLKAGLNSDKELALLDKFRNQH